MVKSSSAVFAIILCGQLSQIENADFSDTRIFSSNFYKSVFSIIRMSVVNPYMNIENTDL